MDKTLSMIKTPNDADKHAEKEHRAALVASFANLSDEGGIMQKIMKFATAWGRQRLESDILGSVGEQVANLKTAVATYEKNTKDTKTGYDDKEFGKMLQAFMTTLLVTKNVFIQWSNT